MRALEFITEAVTDNYLYHSIQSVGTFRKIISTGEIKPYTPIEYEENDIELPVISASRNQYYRFPYGGGNIQFVIDKNALKQSGFKVKPYSYAQHYATKKGQSSVTGNELYKQETEEQIFPIKGHGIPVRSPYIVGIQINPKFKDTSELEEIQELAKSINIPISFMKTSTKPPAKKVDIKLTPKFDPNRFTISAATGAAKEYFPLMLTDKNNPGRKWGLEANYTNTDINHILQDVTEGEYSKTDESIEEAEEDTPNANLITTTLKKAGYKQLGSGADSTVWSKDEGSVIKIIMPEEGEAITTAANTFYKFYEFCQKNKDVPNLPKFIDIGGKHHATFEINGKEYLQIAMERLYPIPNNSVQEALVWALSDFVLSHTPWNKVVSTINNTEYFKNYEAANVQQIEQAVKQTLSNKQENEKYHYLYELMRLVYATGRINKVGWDLHTENVMMRKNGELVIIDPWFAMNEGS